MQYTAQIIHSQFTEVFNVLLEEDSLDIHLQEVLPHPRNTQEHVTLDLSGTVRESYNVFPYEEGDLSLIQFEKIVVLAHCTSQGMHWVRTGTQEIIEFILEKSSTVQALMRYMQEDEQILLNSLLADVIRNDYSYSDLNKKVKYLKVAILHMFLREKLQLEFRRVILDETIIGDIDVDQIALAHRYSQVPFLEIVKIDNVTKIIILLEQEGILQSQYRFAPRTCLLTTPKQGEKFKLLFRSDGEKSDYPIHAGRNYVFDLDEKIFHMNIDNLFTTDVTGKVFVYNGDDRDLMLKS